MKKKTNVILYYIILKEKNLSCIGEIAFLKTNHPNFQMKTENFPVNEDSERRVKTMLTVLGSSVRDGEWRKVNCSDKSTGVKKAFPRINVQ